MNDSTLGNPSDLVTSRASSISQVLVVEDDPDLAVLIARHLTAIPVQAESIGDGDAGLTRALSEPWDLLVLDVRLPSRDGLDVCREVRVANPCIPILMLTALGTELDRVLGLEMGADDYLTKPFSVVELQARVRALLRRGRLLAGHDSAKQSLPGSIQVGPLQIDRDRRRTWFNEIELQLTRREFDLLWQFASYPGQVFSRSELLESVWGQGHDGYDHTVNSHINRLRGKLKRCTSCVVRIDTVWGVGYRFVVER